MRSTIVAVVLFTAGAVVNPLSVGRDIRFPPGFEFFAGADAAIGAPLREQVLYDCRMPLGVVGLAQRSLVPIDSEPAHPVEDGLFRLAGGPLEVGVLDSEHEFAAEAASEGPVKKSGAGTADMKKPRGAGSESSANVGHGGPSISQLPRILRVI